MEVPPPRFGGDLEKNRSENKIINGEIEVTGTMYIHSLLTL